MVDILRSTRDISINITILTVSYKSTNSYLVIPDLEPKIIEEETMRSKIRKVTYNTLVF